MQTHTSPRGQDLHATCAYTRLSTTALADPRCTIYEAEPWLEESKQEDEESSPRSSISSMSSLSLQRSVEWGIFDDLHGMGITEDGDNSLRRTTSIVPQLQLQSKQKSTRPSLGNTLLSALNFAASSAASAAGRQWRARGASPPSEIRTRPSVAGPWVEQIPKRVDAWESEGERASNASASTGLSGSWEQPSTSLDSTQFAQAWTNDQ